ncbi:hypothetical protein HPB47_015025 [Ixodes persulcatus]|uniref:Uncharacterized protein n=1 Tax=Ixodes persulcatus TaxID=34615 RepID=A0AC60QVG1_IXOPE|nr:hypothetical protein HPB47_015025 [Ixodes persulcatus]
MWFAHPVWLCVAYRVGEKGDLAVELSRGGARGPAPRTESKATQVSPEVLAVALQSPTPSSGSSFLRFLEGAHQLLLDHGTGRELLLSSHSEAQVLQSRCVPGLHEQTLLVESVKEALQRRCAAQAEYELAKETLAKGKQEHQQLQSPSSGGLSLDALLRRDTAQHRKDKAQRLESSLQQQEEQLELRRGQQEGLSKQLDGELQRWEQHRQGALRKVFLLLAEQQLQCLQQCLSAWEGALVALRKPDPDGTADAST